MRCPAAHRRTAGGQLVGAEQAHCACRRSRRSPATALVLRPPRAGRRRWAPPPAAWICDEDDEKGAAGEEPHHVDLRGEEGKPRELRCAPPSIWESKLDPRAEEGEPATKRRGGPAAEEGRRCGGRSRAGGREKSPADTSANSSAAARCCEVEETGDRPEPELLRPREL
ncbi:unnamed protein product [Urochloa humidicola]